MSNYALRLGHSTPDMTDYQHLFWMLKPDYSETVERVSMREVQPRKDGDHGHIDPYAYDMFPDTSNTR